MRKMTARSRSAGLSRGSVPDLRRVMDLQRHGTVTLTSAHQHSSGDQLASSTVPAASATEPPDSHQDSHLRDEPLQTSHNGVVTKHHHHHQHQQHQQLGTAAAATFIKTDDVFKIAEHVAVTSSLIISMTFYVF